MIVMSASILVVALWSAIAYLSGETSELASMRALMVTVGVGSAVGVGMWFGVSSAKATIGRREAILLVSLSWFVGAGLAALPFRLWPVFAGGLSDHPFSGFVSCYFESMSGLTTTGASVLTEISALPRSLLLWRALTHWLGGLGIVVLFVAVLPMLGVGGKRLFRVEAAGPSPDGVTPRIQDTARVLWLIYLGLTVAEILALRVVGMGWFDAVCHTFATLATGGFSTHNASLAGFRSVGIDLVVLFFMVLAGVNFGLYFHVLKRRWRTVWTDVELRCYLGIIVVGSAVVVWSIHGQAYVTITGEVAPQTIGSTFQYGVFQVVSVQTTTGYCTADFNQWPVLAKIVMLLLMCVGGCAGSTGGGFKVVRCIMAAKIIMAEIYRSFRPQVVRPIKIGNVTVDADLRSSTMIYLFTLVLLTFLGAAGLMVLEREAGMDATTATTASLAMINNIGPGLGRVGAANNYGWLTDGSKILTCVLMALGRLEVFSVIVLFHPQFWRKD